MKHPSLTDLVISLSAAAECTVSPAEADLLSRHLSMVLDRNSTMNLTAITDPEEAVRLHVVDSLTLAPVLAALPPGELADIGSGAGFPGIPLTIVTGRKTTLVESLRKKAAFLSECVNELALPATVCPCRAEELAEERPAAFAVVVARAVASLPSLVELAAPLLAPGGHCVAMKGELDAEERERAQRVAAIVGLALAEEQQLRVPGAEHRIAVVFRRVSDSSRRLPRRAGMAQKRPLA